MKKNTFSTLEFDRIIDHLAQLTISTAGRELILQIQPLSDLAVISQNLGEVSELKDILDFDDPFPLYGMQDIRPALKKAQIVGNFLFASLWADVLFQTISF